jgi:hypothetical protein
MGVESKQDLQVMEEIKQERIESERIESGGGGGEVGRRNTAFAQYYEELIER